MNTKLDIRLKIPYVSPGPQLSWLARRNSLRLACPSSFKIRLGKELWYASKDCTVQVNSLPTAPSPPVSLLPSLLQYTFDGVSKTISPNANGQLTLAFQTNTIFGKDSHW